MGMKRDLALKKSRKGGAVIRSLEEGGLRAIVEERASKRLAKRELQRNKEHKRVEREARAKEE